MYLMIVDKTFEYIFVLSTLRYIPLQKKDNRKGEDHHFKPIKTHYSRFVSKTNQQKWWKP